MTKETQSKNVSKEYLREDINARTERHVAQFLNMINSEGQIADLARRYFRPRREDVGTSEVAAAVERWLIAHAKKRYGENFDLRNPSELAVTDARDAAAALHLLMARSAQPARKLSADDPAQITRWLEALEPDFPERMLTELRQRELRNATFARELGRARAWVAATVMSLQQSLREAKADDEVDTSQEDRREDAVWGGSPSAS